MAFPREEDVTKDSIGDYTVTFIVSITEPDTGKIEAQIIASSGKPFIREYNLIERLQDDAPGLVHLANLIDLRDYLNARLPVEVLPL